MGAGVLTRRVGEAAFPRARGTRARGPAVDGRDVTLCHAVVHFGAQGQPLSRWLLVTEAALHLFLPPSSTPLVTVPVDAITQVSTSRYWDHIVCLHTTTGPDVLVVDDQDKDLVAEIQRIRGASDAAPKALPVRTVARYEACWQRSLSGRLRPDAHGGSDRRPRPCAVPGPPASSSARGTVQHLPTAPSPLSAMRWTVRFDAARPAAVVPRVGRLTADNDVCAQRDEGAVRTHSQRPPMVAWSLTTTCSTSPRNSAATTAASAAAAGAGAT